ncbi:UDP-glucose:Glyco protein glucosyltransferase-domain-containing protein, partial [Blyttiomyces helicus]
LIGPIPLEKELTVSDFQLISKIELQNRVSNLAEKVVKLADAVKSRREINDEWYSNTILKLSSFVGVAVAGSKSAAGGGAADAGNVRLPADAFDPLARAHTAISLGNATTAVIRVTAIVDPIAEATQKTAALLAVIGTFDGVHLDLILIPSEEAESGGEQLPIKRFYRYVLQAEPAFDKITGDLVPPTASFLQIPVAPLLTLGTDVAGSWLVFPTESIYDLDNIKLSNLDRAAQKEGVRAEFALQNILVEGHARDSRTNGPPRGLQFTLGTQATPSLVDTITMANLGYLQLKANPGVWDLRLREGRSRSIYEFEAVVDSHAAQYRRRRRDNNTDLLGDAGARVVVNSFEGVTLYPIVRKKAGMEEMDVLEPDVEHGKESGGIWNQIKTNIFGGEAKSEPTINVFSVASGHLYERFLSIMMLSVVKNTKSGLGVDMMC